MKQNPDGSITLQLTPKLASYLLLLSRWAHRPPESEIEDLVYREFLKQEKIQFDAKFEKGDRNEEEID